MKKRRKVKKNQTNLKNSSCAKLNRKSLHGNKIGGKSLCFLLPRGCSHIMAVLFLSPKVSALCLQPLWSNAGRSSQIDPFHSFQGFLGLWDLWTCKILWRTSATHKTIWKFSLSFLGHWVLGRKHLCSEDYSKSVACHPYWNTSPFSCSEQSNYCRRQKNIFSLSLSFCSAAVAMSGYVDGFLILHPISFPDVSELNHSVSLLASAKGKAFPSL